MDPLDTKKRIFAAHKLLNENSTTGQKIEQIKILLKGFNPRVEKLLHITSESFSKLEKLKKGEVVELTVEHLPENTEEKRKRKKALLLFIQNWKRLQNEVQRVKLEFEKDNQTLEQKIQTSGRIVTLAKGPLGIITVIAVLSVISFSVIGRNKKTQNQDVQNPAQKTQVIIVDGKQVPLSELITGQGQECMTENQEALHYHAKNHTTVRALDGTVISDPGGCGFGKVKEVQVLEME